MNEFLCACCAHFCIFVLILLQVRPVHQGPIVVYLSSTFGKGRLRVCENPESRVNEHVTRKTMQAEWQDQWQPDPEYDKGNEKPSLNGVGFVVPCHGKYYRSRATSIYKGLAAQTAGRSYSSLSQNRVWGYTIL